MSAGSITEVGGRLVLTGGAQAAADAQKLAANIDKVTASADAAAAAIDRMAGAQERAAATGGAAAGGAAAGGVTTAEEEAAAAEAAALRKQTAAKDTTTVVKEESAKQATAFEQLAGNSTIKKISTWGTGALAVAAYESVKQYSNFNKLVTQSAVDAGAKASDLPRISAALLQDSRDTGVAAADMANSFYRVQSAMAGTHTSLTKILALTKDAAKLDVLFNVPSGNQTEQTARIMGAMLNSGLAGAKTPDQIMALTNVSVGHGDIRGADLIGALGKMLPAAKAMGANAFDMTGWVDMLTKQGMQGSQAGTLIAHSVQQLANPSEQGQKAEQMIGLDPNGPNSLKEMLQTKGIPATVKYLTDSMKKFNPTSFYPQFGTNAPGIDSASAQLTAWGITDPSTMAAFKAGNMTKQQQSDVQNALLSKIFGGAKGAMPMLALTGNESGYADLVKSLHEGATPAALARSYALAQNTPARQMTIARANVAATGIDIGKEITPAVTEGLRIFGQIAKQLSEHPAALYGILGAITAITAGSVVVTTISKLQKLGSSIGDLGKSAASIGSSIGRWITGAAAPAASLAPEEMMQGAATTISAAADKMMTAASAMGGAAAGEEGAAGTMATAGTEELAAGTEQELGGAEGLLGTKGGKGILGKLLGGGAGGGGLLSDVLGPALVTLTAAAGVAGVAYLGGKYLPGNTSTLDRITGTGPQIGGTPFVTPGQAAAAAHNLPGGPSATYGAGGPPTTHPWFNLGGGPHHGRHYNTSATDVYHPPGWHAPTPIMLPAPMAAHVQSIINATRASSQSAFSKRGPGGTFTDWSISGHQVAANENKAGGAAESAAAKQLAMAASLHQQSANDTKLAATQTGQAAADSTQAAKQHENAAKQHAEAAAKLASAAAKIEAAANKLGNTTITAQISATQVAAANTQQQANAQARS